MDTRNTTTKDAPMRWRGQGLRSAGAVMFEVTPTVRQSNHHGSAVVVGDDRLLPPRAARRIPSVGERLVDRDRGGAWSEGTGVGTGPCPGRRGATRRVGEWGLSPVSLLLPESLEGEPGLRNGDRVGSG